MFNLNIGIILAPPIEIKHINTLVKMKLQRLIILVLFISGFSTSLLAQDYSIIKKTQRINNTKYEGFAILVNGSFEKVSEQIYAYLKPISKIRRKRDHYSISEYKMDKIQLDSTLVYLKLIEKESNHTSVWMGAKANGLSEERIAEIENGLNAELIFMARDYYVHEQEIKINQAEAAAQVISKKQQALINEKVSLEEDLVSAEDRKIELDALLESNRLTIASLKQKLIDNKFNQDSTYLDLQKVNRVIEGQKKKLKEID